MMMTVTLELKPEIEARVAAQAAAQGLSVEDYIQSVVESLAAAGSAPDGLTFEMMTPAERAGAWDEWLGSDEGAAATAPAVLDDSRESIYREREDAQL